MRFSTVWTFAMFAATAGMGSAQNPSPTPQPEIQAQPSPQAEAVIQSSLHCHESWDSPSPTLRVVLVHGFGSRAASLSPLADRLARDGFCVATFQYDSHSGVCGAAEQLAIRIDEITQQFPQDKIAVVTHSMGGLVARWMLEQSGDPPANIDRLIMVAPPNAGSALASLNAASLVERGGATKSLTPAQQKQIDQLDEMLSSMLGVGVGDLKPDSDVLQQLGQPQIPSTVRYSILAGDDGPMPAEAAGIGLALKLAAAVTSPRRRDAIAKPGQPARLDQMMNTAGDWFEFAGQPEWVSGQGDGVVSIASTRLPGVNDHEVLPVKHNTLTGTINSDGGRQLIDAIEKRLQPLP